MATDDRVDPVPEGDRSAGAAVSEVAAILVFRPGNVDWGPVPDSWYHRPTHQIRLHRRFTLAQIRHWGHHPTSRHRPLQRPSRITHQTHHGLGVAVLKSFGTGNPRSSFVGSNNFWVMVPSCGNCSYSNVRMILASNSSSSSLDELADKIMDVASPSVSAIQHTPPHQLSTDDCIKKGNEHMMEGQSAKSFQSCPLYTLFCGSTCTFSR